MNYWLQCIKKYVDFDGRARRKEYWMFFLFTVLIGYAISFVLGLADMGIVVNTIGNLYPLALLLPGIAVMVRRLHDTGRSGWWLLIGFVPYVGQIALLVSACLDSQPGDNAYGKYPK